MFHVSSLKEQTESVIRSWLGMSRCCILELDICLGYTGTRWIQRWDKEVDLLTKLVYYALTTGRGMWIPWGSPPYIVAHAPITATQTLGEEYTDIWQYDSRRSRFPPSTLWRFNFIALNVLPSYILAKVSNASSLAARRPQLVAWLKKLSQVFSVASELNLAIFYLRGSYYNPIQRLLGVRNVSPFCFK